MRLTTHAKSDSTRTIYYLLAQLHLWKKYAFKICSRARSMNLTTLVTTGTQEHAFVVWPELPCHKSRRAWTKTVHYYRNANLSRLGNPFCPGFPIGPAKAGQRRAGFHPGSGNRDQRGCHPRRGRQALWSLLVFLTGTKGPLLFFFSVFSFPFISFSFQLYFYFRIQAKYELH